MLRTQNPLGFQHDLIIGKRIENEVCEIIKRKYPQAYVIDGYYKGGDIYIPEKNILVEVKYDEMSHQTGNYCIEIEYNSEPSALTTTLAQWWVIVDRVHYLWIETETLRMIIRDRKLRAVKLKGRGDSKEKVAYLIKKDVLLYSPYSNTFARGN